MDAQTFQAILVDVAAGEPVYKVIPAHGSNNREFYAALAEDAKREQYARAKADGLERLADDIIEIADDGTRDTYIDDNGLERTNQDVIARSRLRVDSRKWLLSKLAPKKYGDKVDLTHAGPDGGAIITRVERIIIDSKDASSSGRG